MDLRQLPSRLPMTSPEHSQGPRPPAEGGRPARHSCAPASRALTLLSAARTDLEVLWSAQVDPLSSCHGVICSEGLSVTGAEVHVDDFNHDRCVFDVETGRRIASPT